MKKLRFCYGPLGMPVIVLLLLLAGCNAGAPQQETDEYQTDGLFVEYQAVGYEERGEVVVRAQFRLGGPEGQLMMPDSPAAVYFDGQLMDTGTTKMTGRYYEAVFDAAEDGGKLHVIEYKDAFGRASRDSFYFPFFRLTEELPETISRANSLVIRFSGFDTGDIIHAMLSDTSFFGRGIDRVDSIRDGLLNFSPSELNSIHNGPVHIEFYREKENWLRNKEMLRGRLYLSYNISREFELVD